MVRIHPDPPERKPGFTSEHGVARDEKRADQGASRRRVDRLLHKAASNAERRSLSAGEGAVAQLGEHLLCKQGVNGSIPFSSTILDWHVRLVAKRSLLEVEFLCPAERLNLGQECSSRLRARSDPRSLI